MTLLHLALYFCILSLISVGGLPSVMGEVQRIVVEEQAWVTAPEFVQLYAVGQASPGPNVLIVALIGWKVAGLAGALVALFSMCGPAAAVSWWVSGLWERFKDSPLRAVIQRAMVPLVVGLTAAGGVVLATPGSTPDWRMWLIAVLACGGMLAFKKLNPLWLLAGGGLIGAILL
ncbi:MAG: chromate transporter [Betaproteobacteria bacterium]|nr:chromate transporter [Betaproteobacteria bacterium]